MTYPNSPFGQEFPDQSGYPEPSYTQQPLPPLFSHPQQQPSAGPSVEPSGATGITAAVFAALGAVAGIGTSVLAAIAVAAWATSSSGSGAELAFLIIVTALNAAFGVMCAIGAVKLRERQMRGRCLVVGSCALAIVSTLLIFGVTAAEASSYGYHAREIFAVVGTGFPIVTMVLALVPSTTAWIEAEQNPVAPQPYPQHPGWG